MGQISAGIDDNSGNVFILDDGRPVFGMAPKDMLSFIGGVAGLIAQHPCLKTVDVAPKIITAGVVPMNIVPTGGRFNGRG